ncbi:exo-alpha-sialidase [Filimonas effusa]|uniref:Six-hairpin glycosidase n=1 Tax=Filimonas effusa TaxID=2508721 RepID=A0A4Q1DDR0_9BACT|nr:exo-alpha-sialidase [Filimonas effusa]RXK86719.1 six-hairpin glycosidase [Filimonas effusa]
MAALTMAQAQDTVRYTGSTLSNVDYHHGQLSPAVGVHNIQVLRASREHPELTDGFGWTYNHAPMLAYWNETFYLEYLADPVGEHIPPSQTSLLTSKDGANWSKPVVIFPQYKIPDGTRKEGNPVVAKDLYATMHQRIGFYTASNKKLLALGFYGITLDAKDDPNDGNGIGRVVREIKTDGTFGPIYFIRYNHAFNPKNTSYPFYASSKDKAFVAACNELLSKPLMMQQWVEEADRDDVLIPLKKQYKAFSFYHLPDGRTVGLWKYALTSISKDDGKTWQYVPLRAPGFVNANAKIWGQKMPDGKFATVYNPSEFRWPLAISVSDNGLDYKNLLLVNGEISTMRYGGNYKSYGPQYVRGIQEGDGVPPGNRFWVTYSMNKEDLWVSSIPTPVRDKVAGPVNDVFSTMPADKALDEWNIFSPVWARVTIEQFKGKQVLAIHDKDPFDYAKAERVIPASKRLVASFTVIPQQDNHGSLQVEFQDARGYAGLRLMFDSTGSLQTKAGYRNKKLYTYKAGEKLDIKVELNTANRFYTVSVNGKVQGGANLLFAPIDAVHRISFRTGDIRRFPDADTPTDQMWDVPDAGRIDREAVYYLENLSVQ